MATEYVGIDLHRRRSVIVRRDADGEVVEEVRIDNDPVALACAIERAGPEPEVAVEATYGWYWAVDVLQACGARVHLAHPLGLVGAVVFISIAWCRFLTLRTHQLRARWCLTRC